MDLCPMGGLDLSLSLFGGPLWVNMGQGVHIPKRSIGTSFQVTVMSLRKQQNDLTHAPDRV